MEISSGRVAVVTGGSRGIGAAIAGALRVRGVEVVVGDLAPRGDDIHLDVANAESREAFVAHVLGLQGGVDILINNAGINYRGGLADTDDDTWRRIMDVNLDGAAAMCRTLLPTLTRRMGHVVNLCSTSGGVAIPGATAYGVSKAALLHLTRVLALEWADLGIRVNAVAPTMVATRMTASLRADSIAREAKLDSIPLGRMPTVEEVAHAVTFLCSEGAASITGQVIYVDGGVTLR